MRVGLRTSSPYPHLRLNFWPWLETWILIKTSGPDLTSTRGSTSHPNQGSLLLQDLTPDPNPGSDSWPRSQPMIVNSNPTLDLDIDPDSRTQPRPQIWDPTPSSNYKLLTSTRDQLPESYPDPDPNPGSHDTPFLLESSQDKCLSFYIFRYFDRCNGPKK